MEVIVIETPQLGDRSYLVHDGSVALVIDPQRDTDRIEAAARDAGVAITHVAETHMHNDYITGGLILARAHGASYLVNAADPVGVRAHARSRTAKRSGWARSRSRPSPRPGHTHTHLSFIVDDGGKQAVFSGGSLLYGSVGRTDLVAEADTVGLTHDQYASVRRLAAEAGPDAALFPTHGFGSFCSSGPASRRPVLHHRRAAHRQPRPDGPRRGPLRPRAHRQPHGPTPRYYAHMSPANVRGPGPAELAVPESLDAAELTRRLDGGEWVVDLRRRVAFASSHLKGSVSFEYGSGSSFTTYLGWVLPWGEQLTLVGSREDIENAIRDLSRIGIESPDAAVGTEPHAAGAAGRPRLLSPRGLGRRARRPGRRGHRRWTCAGPTNSPPRGCGRGQRAAARTVAAPRASPRREALGALRVRVPCRDRRQPAAARRPGRGPHRRQVRRRRVRRDRAGHCGLSAGSRSERRARDQHGGTGARFSGRV